MAPAITIGGDGTLFVGEDKILNLEVLNSSDVPVDLTGMVIQFVVRLRDNTADPAIFNKTAAIVGVYSVVRASNTQRARVTLSDTEMNTVIAKAYRYSFKRMDDGSETVLVYGDFEPQKATAP